MPSYEVIIASVPDREFLVAEIWVRDRMIAEINQEKGSLEIEFFQGQYKDLALEFYLLGQAMDKAKRALLGNKS